MFSYFYFYKLFFLLKKFAHQYIKLMLENNNKIIEILPKYQLFVFKLKNKNKNQQSPFSLNLTNFAAL